MASNGDLEAQLRELDEKLGKIHVTLAEENVKRDKRIRTNRIAMFLAMGVGVLGLFVGFNGWQAQRNANSERDKARIASCKQYNMQQEQGIAAEIAQSHDLVDGLKAQAARPIPQDVIDAYNARHDALIHAGHPLRDCSPAGIEKYLNATRVTP